MKNEESQYAIKQMLQKKAEKERLLQVEEKLKKMIQNQKELEENDFKYEAQIKTIDEKRIEQMVEIKKLQLQQKEELGETKQLFSHLLDKAKIFQEQQHAFISQQKKDRDMVKSFMKTQVAKDSIIDAGNQSITVQNPFLLLSKSQGLLDSQFDNYYQQKISYFEDLLDQELSYNVSQIIITFISYKPDIPSIEVYQERQFQGISQQIPMNMYFLIDFYDYPTFKTNSMIYEDCPTLADLRNAISHDQDLKLVFEKYYENQITAKKPTFHFDLDVNAHTLYYLLFKSVYVRVIDSITAENYGYFQIPLNSILRGNKQQEISIIECQLLNFDWKLTNGIFSISLQNLGKNSDLGTQSNFLRTSQAFNFGQTYQSNFIKTATDFNKTQIQTEDERINLRISLQKNEQSLIFQGQKSRITSQRPKSVVEYKKSAITNKKLSDVPKNKRYRVRIQEVKKDLLNHLSVRDEYGKYLAIQYDRAWKKKELIKQVLPDQLRESAIIIDLKRGEKYIQQLCFNSIQTQDLELEITDQTCSLVQSEELDFIYNSYEIPQEARFRVEGQKVKVKKDQQGVIMLIFYDKQEIKKKEIGVYIKSNRIAIGGQLYQIEPQEQIIDLTLQFYQKPESQLQLKLPPIYSFCEIHLREQPILCCDDHGCSLSIDQQLFLILGLKTAEIGKSKIVHIFLYRDKFMHTLLLTLRILIHSLPSIELSVQQGRAQIHKLIFKSDTNRLIYFHSLNKNKVWLESPFNVPIQVDKEIAVPIKIFQMSDDVSQVRLNVVDQNSQELVYGWLLDISTTIPVITQILKFHCNFRQIHPLRVVYKNTSIVILNLNIVSSDYLINVLKSEYRVIPQMKCEFELCIQKGEEYPNQALELIERQREIKVFVFDQANSYFECYLFQIFFDDN